MRPIKTVLIHLCIWIAYVTLAIVVYGYENNMANVIYDSVGSYAISASVFYIHAYWLLPTFMERKRIGLYSLVLLGLFCYNFLARYLFFFVLDTIWFDTPSATSFLSINKVSLLFSWQAITYCLFSTGYWLALRTLKAERSARLNEKLQLENAALRAQINPHFLFNTLDFVRIKLRALQPQLSETLLALMEVLRSAIAKPDKDGLIPVDREIKVIDKLANIYKDRFPNIHLIYEKNISAPEFRMPQHVLLAFVENAFKHGSYSNPEKALKIQINVDRDQVLLQTFNKKANRINDHSHGIGVRYIKQQLETFFPGRYQLQLNDGLEDYSVSLKIFGR